MIQKSIYPVGAMFHHLVWDYFSYASETFADVGQGAEAQLPVGMIRKGNTVCSCVYV